MMHLLVDTDILLYKAATSAETEIDWGQEIWSLFTDLNDAKKSFVYQLDKIKEALNQTQLLSVRQTTRVTSESRLTPAISPTGRTA